MSVYVTQTEWDLGRLLRAGRHVNPLSPEPRRRKVTAPKPPTIGPSGWARRKRGKR